MAKGMRNNLTAAIVFAQLQSGNPGAEEGDYSDRLLAEAKAAYESASGVAPDNTVRKRIAKKLRLLK